MPQPLVAVDIGNTRIKLGWFEADAGGALPLPVRIDGLAATAWDDQQLLDWLPGPRAPGNPTADDTHKSNDEIADQMTAADWVLSSVNRPAADRLADWLTVKNVNVRLLTRQDVPIALEVDEPQNVGLDRLVADVAANVLRDPDRPAIVVDLGTAITVDLISVGGAFVGGAILPGMSLAARALHEHTDQLPQIEPQQIAGPPPALGKSTRANIDSGLFWGAVGAIRELVERLAADQPAPPQVFVTGGAAPAVVDLLDDAQHVPHLLLSGIAVSHRASKS